LGENPRREKRENGLGKEKGEKSELETRPTSLILGLSGQISEPFGHAKCETRILTPRLICPDTSPKSNSLLKLPGHTLNL
jgi:hypothetical protein